MELAKENTSSNLETCGILGASLVRSILYTIHLKSQYCLPYYPVVDFVFLVWIFGRYVFLVWVFCRYVFHSYHSWGQLRIISLIEFEIPQLNGGFIAKLRLDCVLFFEKHGEFSELGACFWGITFSECCIKILVTTAVVTWSYLEFLWTTYY